MASEIKIPQRSFAGGEISPRLAARADLDRFRISLALMQNCVVLPEGGATKRSGTRLVAEALASSSLVAFRFSDSDGYAQEFGNLKMRLFRDYGAVESSPGVPFEFTTPITTAEAAILSVDQVNDVQMLAAGAQPIQRLTRLGHTSWTIEDLPVVNGPFRTQNAVETTVLYHLESGEVPKGTSFTLYSTSATFLASHVGALFLLKEMDGEDTPMWEPGVDFDVDDFRRWDINTYKCTASVGGHGGGSPPVHLQGSQWDGAGRSGDNGGRLWLYLHSGYGIVKVTAYTAPDQVTVTAQSYIPSQIKGIELDGDYAIGGTWKWAEGAWSDVRGYPKVLAFHEQRLCAANTSSEPNGFDASVKDDFVNFHAGVLDTDAFRYRMEGNKKTNPITDIIPSKRLLINTGGDEFVLEPSAVREPISPDNVVITPATSKGARGRGVKIDTPIFISRTGRRIHNLYYDFQREKYVANNLMRLADHFGISPIVKMAWQHLPYMILWVVRADGLLIGFTYDPDENTLAWHRHRMPDARVKDIAVVPNPDGIREDLWLIVERDFPGPVTKRYIECLMPFFEASLDDTVTDGTNGFFVDCGVPFDVDPGETSFAVPWPNGTTVKILADGKVHPDKIVGDVESGKVKLDYPAKVGVLGLPYNARLRTLPYDYAENPVNSVARKVRASKVAVQVVNTAGISARATKKNGEYNAQQVLKSAGGIVSGPIALKTGVFEVDIDSGWDEGGQVEIISDIPLPCTVLAITPVANVAGS